MSVQGNPAQPNERGKLRRYRLTEGGRRGYGVGGEGRECSQSQLFSN